MNYKIVPTNEVVVEVTPRNPGNYGIFRISGQERDIKDEIRLAEQIESDIKRHVDDVEYTEVKPHRIYQSEDGSQYESLFEMLSSQFEYDGTYTYRYVRPSDENVGTRGSADTFEELVETAFSNPHQFEVKDGELNDEQQAFLEKVIEAGKVKKCEWV